MSANQAQNKGIEVVLVPLLRLPWRYDEATNQNDPEARCANSGSAPGPCRRTLEGDVD